MNINFEPSVGFDDYWGDISEKHDFTSIKLTSYFRLCGFNKIKLPTLEKQIFLSSEFVGVNPWPDWHPKSLYAVSAKNYNEAYEEVGSVDEKYFLIPEGTTSVCRWVSSKIAEDPNFIVQNTPIKLFYTSLCFRNELVNKVSPTKKREFTQIGLEYFGVKGTDADLEILFMMAKSLINIGFEEKQVRLRVSDVRLFNHIVKDQGININNRNSIKTLLDQIASNRAMNDIDKMSQTVAKLENLLNSLDLSIEQLNLWKVFYNNYLTKGDLEGLSGQFPTEVIESLKQVLDFFAQQNFQVLIDPSIIRSQDYYNSMTFQSDLLIDETVIPEVGGGGRYDYFINRLFDIEGESTLPATGFAYSIERIVAAMEVAEMVVEDSHVTTRFGNETDYVCHGDLKNNLSVAEELRLKGKKVDIFISSQSKEDAIEYAKKQRAELIS